MRVIVCTAYGEPDVLKIDTVEKPIPGEKQVLIKMIASTISTVDSAFRKGEPFLSRLFTGLSKPVKSVPGDIVAGIIESTGADVTRFKPGERVMGHAGTDFGAHAEYLVLNEDEAIIPMPDSMSYEEGASIAYSGMTALPFIRDYLPKGERVSILINGASGAIGSTAVQLAREYGAHVTGVCSGSNSEMVLSMGAHETIDYSKENFCDGENRYDLIFDAVGKSSYKLSRSVLTDKGIYLSTVPNGALMLRTLFGGGRGKKGKFLATGLRKNEEKIADLRELISLYEKGVIKPVIAKSYELDEIVEAHRFVDRGHANGNVILKPGSE